MKKAIGHIPEPVVESLKRGTNFFLAIGINKYQHYNPLHNAVKDVVDVAEVLMKDYYFEQKNIRLLIDEEATRENIIEELNDLRVRINQGDRLLIFYSGHGYMDGELGFWVPVDAKRERKASLVNNSEVQAIIRTIKAQHILLISDSCYSGSLLVRDASRSPEGAFVDFERNPSRYVFTSGKGEVMDGKIGENSPFADAILKNLQSNDSAINILLLADQVTKRVRFNYEQKAECAPMYQSGHDGGQFVFFKRQTEKDRWENALKHNNEAGYLAYLNENPKGEFAQQAEQNMFSLADEKAWQNASFYDSAFSYHYYSKNYPNGKYVLEAHAKLDVFKRDNEVRERLDKIENEKQAKSEADKLERDRLAKSEADKLERDRLAKIEADKFEREKMEKIEADKKIDDERKEIERKAKIKFDKKIEADKIKHERSDSISTFQQNQKYVLPETIPTKKNYTRAVLGGSIVVGLILTWFLSRPAQTTTTISTPVENNYVPPTKEINSQPTTTTGTPVENNPVPPNKKKYNEITLGNLGTQAEEINKYNGFLNSATTSIDAGYKSDAVSALKSASNCALNINLIPVSLIQNINSAQTSLENDNFQEAKKYVAKAKYGVVIKKLTPVDRSKLNEYKY